MKLLLDLPDDVRVDDLEGVIRGYTAATSTREINIARIAATGGWKDRDPGIGFAFNTLVVPIKKIEDLVLTSSQSPLDPPEKAVMLNIKTTPAEYAILKYLHDKLNPAKSPF